MTNEYSTLTKNIRYYRIRSNMTQEQLAEKADLSVSYIKKLESSKEFKNVTFNTVSKIAKALNIDIQLLFIDNTKISV